MNVISTIAAVVAILATGSAQASTFICPWADTVVQIEVRESATATITYAIYNRAPTVATQHRPHPLVPAWDSLYFRDLDAAYVYDFWLRVEDASLWNRRVSLAAGEIFEQRGYCMRMPAAP